MIDRKHGSEQRKLPRLIAGTFAAALALAGCADNVTAPVVETATEQGANSKSNVAMDSCTSYGRALDESAAFLVRQASDQSQLPKDWQRGVVVKTIYQPAKTPNDTTWMATLVLPDKSLSVLRSTQYDNLKMAALVHVGDYIAFDNEDGDNKVSAPRGKLEDHDIRFLGHSVIPC